MPGSSGRLHKMTDVREQMDHRRAPGDHQRAVADGDGPARDDQTCRDDDGVVCVITRFRLRHATDLPRTYIDYRRVVRDARDLVGDSLIHTAFLVENLTTCYSLSIWRGEAAIAEFGTRVPRHVAVAGGIFRRLARIDGDNPELWATRWRLVRLSKNRYWSHSSLTEGACLDPLAREVAAHE